MELFRLKTFNYWIHNTEVNLAMDIITREAWIECFKRVLGVVHGLRRDDSFNIYFPSDGQVRTVLCTWFDSEEEVGYHYAFDLYKVDLSVYDNPKLYFNV